ncbi:hypothetical protein B0H10DRAFT_2195371 [Mycena sp. CBHHK59/15]|nr:hypothetical protein B0H10DRAFT_2195371 [Mycena sp. CBHHK59/15]
MMFKALSALVLAGSLLRATVASPTNSELEAGLQSRQSCSTNNVLALSNFVENSAPFVTLQGLGLYSVTLDYIVMLLMMIALGDKKCLRRGTWPGLETIHKMASSNRTSNFHTAQSVPYAEHVEGADHS